jgi:hypothetical protein
MKNKEDLDISMAQHFMFYVDEVSLLGENMTVTKKHTQSLPTARKEAGLEVMQRKLNTY